MLRFAPPFQDHAVLQRDQPIPIWGTCQPNEVVTVRLAAVSGRVTAGPDGQWLLRLPPLPAGGPYELTAQVGSEETKVRDILVGEVWICSGQSNMEWTLDMTPQALSVEEENLPNIRLLSVGTAARQGRQTQIDGRWTAATRESLGSFSAVGGWFGRALHRELDVPQGLINTAWGGTRIQAWISREALMLDPAGRDEVRAYENYAYATDARADNTLSVSEWEARVQSLDTGNTGLERGWASAEFVDSAWKTGILPAFWSDLGSPSNGVYWFRRTVQVPWHGRDLILNLGAIDKHDDTYVNGVRVGGLTWSDGPDAWKTPRTYQVPSSLLAASDQVCIAVRARSHIYHGGMTGPASVMSLHPEGDVESAVSLAGDWRFECEQDWGIQAMPVLPLGPGNANSPYTLFDSRLTPLIPYGIRGFIWYQGESNVGESHLYGRLLPQMIHDWRRAFGQGDLPFLQVQLANYLAVSDNPSASDWALLREAQASALSEPATGMAVTIDVGEANDIHPTDKRSVGERLARWALVETYNHPGMPSGPLYADMTIEAQNRVRIRFRYGAGLRTTDGGEPKQVAIAGIDRVFVWAEARVEDDTLVVWHPQVDRPAAVRYAWADNPQGCNLVNGADLPASPFRTDSW